MSVMDDDCAKFGRFPLLQNSYAAKLPRNQSGDGCRRDGLSRAWRVLWAAGVDVWQETDALATLDEAVSSDTGVLAGLVLDPEGTLAACWGKRRACAALAATDLRTQPWSQRCGKRRVVARANRLLLRWPPRSGLAGRPRAGRGFMVATSRSRRHLVRKSSLAATSTAPSSASPSVADVDEAAPVLDETPLNCGDVSGMMSLVRVNDSAEGEAGREPELGDIVMTDWMRELPNDMPLSRVSMPGTHDSATFDLWPMPVNWEYLRECGRTQEWDIATQLNCGIRFLDLRPKSDGWLYHGPMACRLKLEAALHTCISFVEQHGSELLLLRIKDEEQAATSGRDVWNVLKGCAKRWPQLQLRLDCLGWSVGECRGRVLVLQDWQGPVMSVRWTAECLDVQDNWQPTSLADKWTSVKRQFRRASRSKNGQLHINFVSAQALPQYTARYFADALKPKLAEYLSKYPCQSSSIVVMDFPSRELCLLIVRANFRAKAHLSLLEQPINSYRKLVGMFNSVAQFETKGVISKRLSRWCTQEHEPDDVAKLYVRLLMRRMQFMTWAARFRSQCVVEGGVFDFKEGVRLAKAWEEEFDQELCYFKARSRSSISATVPSRRHTTVEAAAARSSTARAAFRARAPRVTLGVSVSSGDGWSSTTRATSRPRAATVTLGASSSSGSVRPARVTIHNPDDGPSVSVGVDPSHRLGSPGPESKVSYPKNFM